MHTVDLVHVQPSVAAIVRFRIERDDLPSVGEQMGRAFGTVGAALSHFEVRADGPAVAFYTPAGTGFDVAAGFQVLPDANLPPEVERISYGDVVAAHTTHVGAYAELGTAYEDLQKHAQAEGMALSDELPMWEEYWTPPEAPAAETRTEVYWPVSVERS